MERPHRPRPTRAGFTLVELLVAILIIAALLAILLPTVGAAFKRAKEASVSAEMNNMATALASFKNTYNDFPPSRIILSEVGYAALLTNTTPVASGPTGDPNTADITVGLLAQRSLTYLRKFFPRADFIGVPGAGSTQGHFNDFNGNATLDTNYYIINGSECLTFFLGGIPIVDTSVTPHVIKGLSGFSKSPTHPFVDAGTFAGTTTLVAPNRTVPNYEFNNGRLFDQDGDGIPSYFDPLDQTPGRRRTYAYFSAYGTNQYDPNDVNGYGRANTGSNGGAENFELEDDGTTFVERSFSVFFPTSSGTPYFAKSAAPNPYTTGAAAIGTSSTTSTAAVSWYNPNSYQIICSGQDRLWGLGGQYIQNATSGSSLPLETTDPGLIHAGDALSIRQREADNLANFTAGRLQ